MKSSARFGSRPREMPHSEAMPKSWTYCPGCLDPTPGALDAILGVHQAEVQLGLWAEPQIFERRVKGRVGAVDRHRHVEPGDGSRHAARDQIGQLDHPGRIGRLDEVLCVVVAITEVKPQLDIGWHGAAQAAKDLRKRLLHPGNGGVVGQRPSHCTISMHTSHWIARSSWGMAVQIRSTSRSIARS